MAEEINTDPLGPGEPFSGEPFKTRQTEAPQPQTVEARGGNMVGGQFMAQTELKRLSEEPLDWGAAFVNVNPPTTERLFQFKDRLNDFIKATDYFPAISSPNSQIDVKLKTASQINFQATTAQFMNDLAQFLGYKDMDDFKASNPPGTTLLGAPKRQQNPPPTTSQET